jgi:UDP-N-acetylmuramoyl-L-alanyl-D-glutamate--2,6-diaminopimelate ligase
MMLLKQTLRRVLPPSVLSAYHFTLSLAAAIRYGFPSREITVIGITGTKGKSTTAELVYALLAAGGARPALLSTIRFVTPGTSRPNLFKMTMPGRFFVQQFLREAVRAGATHVVIEMTSEGVKQWRHKWVALDALVFTNLSPEHIESHGSFENYAAAKLKLAHLLASSPKKNRVIVANNDDPQGARFLATKAEQRLPFSLKDAEPYTVDDRGCRFTWRGELFMSPLPGVFNLYNILGALTLTEALGIPRETLKKGLAEVHSIPGRAERVECGQDFSVIVDYAHTPDSLRAIYEAFPGKRICVLGCTGGGRDRWKRPVMGGVADEYCDFSILTDDDPYDEDSRSILEDMRPGFKRHEPKLIVDRREAIREALRQATPGSTVLITGKGTDPFLMGPRGQKLPWNDRAIAEEELRKLLEGKGAGAYH